MSVIINKADLVGSEPLWKETTNRIFNDLRNKNDDVRYRAGKQLAEFVKNQVRELSADKFSTLITDVNTRISLFLNSGQPLERAGSVVAIDELIDVEYELNGSNKFTRFGNYLHIALTASEIPIIATAARALGKLIRTGGGSTEFSETVDSELKRSLEWLAQQERYEPRRYSALMILKELAINAPTLFNIHVSGFLDLVWVGLIDQATIVRDAAVESLRACLDVIADRERSLTSQWYRRLWAKSQEGFKQKESHPAAHASLLAVSELLVNTGDFMDEYFKEVCETCLKYTKEAKLGSSVRKTIITILPRLAALNPKLFVTDYLNTVIPYLVGLIRKDTEKGKCYISLGEIAIAVGGSIKPFLESIIAVVKTGLLSKKKTEFSYESLTCMAMLARGIGPALRGYMEELLPEMFNAGLSDTLTSALKTICEFIPTIMPDIQEALLNYIAHTLGHRPFSQNDHPARLKRTASMIGVLDTSGKTIENDPENISLALETLGSFDFATNTNVRNFGLYLEEVIRDTVVNYLDNDDPTIRLRAAQTCAKICCSSSGRHTPVVMSEILEKLLIVGITDRNPAIRQAVLASLDTPFDNYLAQPENLSSLFLALNDEVFGVRELAITVIGRITSRNPAYVMPSIRKTLLQLMGDLEMGGDRTKKEESARLLSQLIGTSSRLLKPYVETIANVLIPNLKEDNVHVSSSVLTAMGELAVAGGEDIKRYFPVLLPLIIDTLQDQRSAIKRQAALKALGTIASHAGCVITPYLDYPQLLTILLDEIKTESNKSIRQELLKVLGILGGLDPYKHRRNILRLGGSSDEQEANGKNEVRNTSAAPTVPQSSAENYYPTVVVNALVRILRDPSLNTHYRIALESLMPVLKNLGSAKCVEFLPIILPPILQIIKTSDIRFKEWLFQELGVLVTVFKHHIRDYVEDILVVIRNNWDSPLLTQIIVLVEDMSVELKEDFKISLQELIPPMLRVLVSDQTVKRQATRKVLHTLETFGSILEDYLHLVIPAVVNLCESDIQEADIPKLAIQVLGRLCKHLNVSDYASRIIHPIVRILDTPTPDPKLKEQHAAVIEMRVETLNTLSSLIFQLGKDYAIFIPMVQKVLIKHGIADHKYETLISRLMKNQPLQDAETDGEQNGEQSSRKNSLVAHSLDEGAIPLSATMPSKLKIKSSTLKKYWEADARATKEDWGEWIRRFSIGLLRESPSPALRSCFSLAQVHYPLVRELFNAAFVSIWNELDDPTRTDLISNLEKALSAPNLPPEILQQLLNVNEFMEQEEKRLPISIIKLGTLAEQSHAYAKALYYKEEEFSEFPDRTIEALISLNNQLDQPRAAEGILKFARERYDVEEKESWYERLFQWEAALKVYQKKFEQNPTDNTLVLGQARCLHALANWMDLENLVSSTWSELNNDGVRAKVASYAATAAWNIGDRWENIGKYVESMSVGSQSTFYQAVLAVHGNQIPLARKLIDQTRRTLDNELSALIGESYNRAYPVVLKVQQLVELEEVIEYKEGHPQRRATIRKNWWERLLGCQRNADTWQEVLLVRSLVLSPLEDEETWLKLVSLCRKSRKLPLASKILSKMLGRPMQEDSKAMLSLDKPRVSFAYIKHLWATEKREEALTALKHFIPKVDGDLKLQSRLYQKLGDWSLHRNMDENTIQEVMSSLKKATEYDPNWHKSWHSWGMAHFEVISSMERQAGSQSVDILKRVTPYLSPAIRGFFKSISLSRAHSLQDTLRILTLWFKYGNLREVEAALIDGFGTVSIDTWLQVIPQIIARIASPVTSVRQLIHDLLVTIGKEHPQALVFPLNVALKSQASQRIAAAQAVMSNMRKHSPILVEQALMVSEELVRISILWNEMWFEGLEDASGLHFSQHNTIDAIARLKPLHELMEAGPQTLAEAAFLQSHGKDLQEAAEWTQSYLKTKRMGDMSQAWDLYYTVFRQTKQAVQSLSSVELEYTSTKLLKAKNLEVAMPGTYKANSEIIRIDSFKKHSDVIASKQHPRKLGIKGSDGCDYTFLLKGHEDIRQDERVMQLFGLVNTLLASEFQTSRHNLSIQRYTVIPLAPNSGLLGWVPNCDTLHALLRSYRDARNIAITLEQRLLLQTSSDYINLCVVQKVEAFKQCLDATDGMDLKKILWLQSQTAEVWLDRRTTFTRSLAVMSMVGYILGLGDRHCSNLMIERQNGKVVHIDFGDCFEVAMHRDKFPEKVPFRLTRMMSNAMGVTGHVGNFQATCESVIQVLRENKESLMAVLEAFVYDPLISWRLLTPNQMKEDKTGSKVPSKEGLSMEEEVGTPNAITKERMNITEAESAIPEVMNEKAIVITERIANKLTGRDFSTKVPLLGSDVGSWRKIPCLQSCTICRPKFDPTR
eukprot:TRINITY_DN4594_c0_g1_i2.p1 TRINITY_DN4594_c0_g1~~TRINITY_DN4594_c0_g1_i2.p1  ORF type:complete len:2365 (-),score=692.80 TRINITY_DN4594_c0_g1_i2:62-7156(-)